MFYLDVAAYLLVVSIILDDENRDFAIAKSQFSTNPMLKKGLTHYKE